MLRSGTDRIYLATYRRPTAAASHRRPSANPNRETVPAVRRRRVAAGVRTGDQIKLRTKIEGVRIIGIEQDSLARVS
jgi:hypothetical protein